MHTRKKKGKQHVDNLEEKSHMWVFQRKKKTTLICTPFHIYKRKANALVVCPNADVKPWKLCQNGFIFNVKMSIIWGVYHSFKGNWIAGFEVISHENEGWCDWIAGHGDRCLSHSDDGVLVGVSNVHVTAAAESSVIWAREIRSKHEKWRTSPPKKWCKATDHQFEIAYPKQSGRLIWMGSWMV